MLQEAVQRGKGDLRVERRPVLPGNLPRKGNIFDGASNRTEVVQMADILAELRKQYPAHEVTV